MNKSCLKCVNKEEISKHGFIVCKINGWTENIYIKEARETALYCPCYKEKAEEHETRNKAVVL